MSDDACSLVQSYTLRFYMHYVCTGVLNHMHRYCCTGTRFAEADNFYWREKKKNDIFLRQSGLEEQLNFNFDLNRQQTDAVADRKNRTEKGGDTG